jgi:urease accessory protein
MLCDRLLTQSDFPLGEIHDYLDLDWWELDRRALRKSSRHGQTLRILLPLGSTLSHGSILTDSAGQLKIQVQVKPCEVFVVHPRDAEEMSNIALELGNLHAPTEITHSAIHTVIDGPVEELIVNMKVPFERQVVRFCPRRCVGMPELKIAAQLQIVRV